MGESPTPSRWWALTALIPLGLFVAAGADVLRRADYFFFADRMLHATNGF